MVLASTPLLAKPVYLCSGNQFQDHPCADSNQSTPIAVDKPPSSPPQVVEPLADLTETPPSASPSPLPMASKRPARCRNLTDRDHAMIRDAVRFWRVVPCMTSEQAVRSIRGRDVQVFDLGGPPGEEITEWVLVPSPRLPNRILIQQGLVIEAK